MDLSDRGVAGLDCVWLESIGGEGEYGELDQGADDKGDGDEWSVGKGGGGDGECDRGVAGEGGHGECDSFRVLQVERTGGDGCDEVRDGEERGEWRKEPEECVGAVGDHAGAGGEDGA
jgi:hypothetical protein